MCRAANKIAVQFSGLSEIGFDLCPAGYITAGLAFCIAMKWTGMRLNFILR